MRNIHHLYLETTASLDPSLGILLDLPNDFALLNLGSARAWLGEKGKRGEVPQGDAEEGAARAGQFHLLVCSLIASVLPQPVQITPF